METGRGRWGREETKGSRKEMRLRTGRLNFKNAQKMSEFFLLNKSSRRGNKQMRKARLVEGCRLSQENVQQKTSLAEPSRPNIARENGEEQHLQVHNE